jgi:hypothetical protein
VEAEEAGDWVTVTVQWVVCEALVRCLQSFVLMCVSVFIAYIY